MSKFRTKFNVPRFDGCVMNPYDAVDRLSYVDSTTQIVKMFQAGVNMKLQNSQLYTYDGDMNAPSMPVYAPDISDAYKRLNEMREQLKENERKRSEEFRKAQEAQKSNVQDPPDRVAKSDLPSGT